MLSLRVRYHPFEPAYAVFGRLALRYGFEDIRFFGTQVGLRFSALSTARAVPVIAEMAGFDAATLMNWSPVPHNKGFLLGTSRFCHHTWNLRSNRRICPRCLRDDFENASDGSNLSLFRRFWWDCQEIDVCPAHRAVLIDECPSCERPLATRSADLRHCACGFDFLQLSAATNIPLEVVDADSYLLDRLMGVQRETASPLDTLTIQNAMAVIKQVGVSWIAVHTGKLLNRRDKQSRLRIKAAGFAALSEWPVRFCQLLDHSVTMVKSGDSRLTTGPYRVYGTLYHWFRQKPEGEFALFTREIESHFKRTIACRSSQHLFGKQVANSTFVTLSYANTFCGLALNSKYLTSLLPFLNNKFLDKPTSSEIQIRRRDLPHLKAMVDHRVSLGKAAERLGVSQTTAKHLVNSGHIAAKRDKKGNVECIFEKSIDNLILKLCSDVEIVDHSIDGCKNIVTCGLGTISVIQSIINGDVSVVAYNSSDVGLRGILISQHDVWTLKSRKTSPYGLTVTSAARTMRMPDKMTSFLVDCGILQTKICPETGKRIIPNSEIEKFRSSYVSLSDLGQLGISPRRILACLQQNGLQPEINRPKFQKIFFRRSNKLRRKAIKLGLNTSRL